MLAKKASSVKQFETLFVLMLDMSGSMSGQPWKDLMNAVTQFLQTIELDANLSANSRVTIISYADYSTLNFD